MRDSKIIAVAFLVALMGLTASDNPVFAHGPHGGSAQLQETNNDRMIAAQVYGGLRKDAGAVTISYYGNMAFEITSPRGLKVFIDPWRNDVTQKYPPWYAIDMPITRTDIGLVTHAHFDHDGVDRLEADMIIERMAGTFELADVKILGIADKHLCENQAEYSYRKLVVAFTDADPCPPGETLEWDNSMYVLETGGMRILHWGDNRQNPPDRVWDQLKNVDIAILPISDDGHILTPEWGDKVADRLDAKILIPSHYYIEGVNIPEAYGLKSAIEWTQSREHTILDTHTITMTPEEIDAYDNHVFYFGDNVAFETGDVLPAIKGENEPVPEPVKAWERFAPKP